MILVPKQSVSRDDVERALLAEGYVVAYRVPRTGSAQSTDWERGADHVAYSSDSLSGLAFFLVQSPEPERLEAMVSRIVPCERAVDVIQRDLRASAPAEQCRAALRCLELGRFLKVDASLPRSSIVDGLSRWLQSDHRAVRTAAAEALFTLDWPELDSAVEAMAARDPDLTWIGPWWKTSRESSEKAEREAAVRRAQDELRVSMNQLVDQKRWDEALSASGKVLTEKKPPISDCARAQALSLEGLGRPWEALFWASVWAGKSKTDDARSTCERIASTVRSAGGTAPDLGDQVLLGWKLLDECDEITGALSRMRGMVPAHERSAALGFFESVFLLEKSYSSTKQKLALALLEPFVPEHPALAEGWTLLALAKVAHGDLAGAEVAYREALRAIAGPSNAHDESVASLASFASFARSLGVDEVSNASVMRAIRAMYEHESDYENLDRVASEEIAMQGGNLAAARRSRAIARTFLKRHDEAIADYRAAMEAGDADENGLLRFNLSCELARAGKKDEAIATLKQAIACDDDWGKKARTDDYFTALWQDADFVIAVSGLTEIPSVDEVERWISRSLGRSMRGEGEESIEEGERAVAGALLRSDRGLQARALGQLGAAQTYYASVPQALDTLERAVTIAREVFADMPVELARTLHFKGAAQHAGKRYDEAEATYREVLTLREKALGAVSFEVAITLGDLARLACDRGALDTAIALQGRCHDTLESALVTVAGDDRLDILLNLALNEGNRAATALDAAKGPQVVLEHAESMTGFLEQLVAGDGSYGAQTLARIRRVLAEAFKNEVEPALTTRALTLADRLLVLEHPDPQVRAEKLYWAGLRGGIHDLKSRGATDREIAEGIARAVRGHDPGEPVSSHPAFQNLAVELARRLTGGGDLVMVAMSLDLAVSGAQPVGEAIGGLETFALANLEGARDLRGEQPCARGRRPLVRQGEPVGSRAGYRVSSSFMTASRPSDRCSPRATPGRPTARRRVR